MMAQNYGLQVGTEDIRWSSKRDAIHGGLQQPMFHTVRLREI